MTPERINQCLKTKILTEFQDCYGGVPEKIEEMMLYSDVEEILQTISEMWKNEKENREV